MGKINMVFKTKMNKEGMSLKEAEFLPDGKNPLPNPMFPKGKKMRKR